MGQQDQTLGYFRSHAEDWQRKAVATDYSNIENRHNAVLATMGAYPEGSTLVDVGSGAGQLAIEASKRGWNATGVDFAEEMIAISQKNNIEAGASATFVRGSIFDHEIAPESVHVISAQGFIEYVSLAQLDDFLALVRGWLKPGGALAVGSRNRLFNLHSLNAFTELEQALGTTDRLLTEARLIQTAGSHDEAVASLAALGFEYDQPETHPVTGVKVDTRYQFSPADLMTKLARHGLNARRVYPVHFHALPLGFMAADPAVKATHKELARHASDNWIEEHRIVPYASSFVMEARKSGSREA